MELNSTARKRARGVVEAVGGADGNGGRDALEDGAFRRETAGCRILARTRIFYRKFASVAARRSVDSAGKSSRGNLRSLWKRPHFLRDDVGETGVCRIVKLMAIRRSAARNRR